jgi:hypothetical protein
MVFLYDFSLWYSNRGKWAGLWKELFIGIKWYRKLFYFVYKRKNIEKEIADRITEKNKILRKLEYFWFFELILWIFIKNKIFSLRPFKIE